MRSHRVVVIPGDGIGPELVEAALRVLDAVQEDGGFSLRIEKHEAGAAYYARHGRRIGEETLAACRSADAILKGPVGDPQIRTPEGTEAGLLGGVLRGGLDLFANVRPVRLYPGVRSPLRDFGAGQIDYVVVRENTEGLYASRDKGVGGPQAMADTMIVTRHGVERIARFAFELARRRPGAPEDGVRRVTCVDKSNVLRSFALFREVFYEVAAAYPDVEPESIYSDACAQALVLHPRHFCVLVAENFIGDIISDLGGATVGGIGMCPSGNYGKRIAYFEPVHGSAPDIAGQGIANPLSQILSAAMLLEKVGEEAAARRVERAVWDALAEGAIRLDERGRARDGTLAVAETVAARVRGG